jgi:TrmH family RNA methyltransferase
VLTKAEIQRLRSLRDKKERESLGLFVVEGRKVVGELIESRFPLVELYATDAWRPAGTTAAARVVAVTAEEMQRISHFPTPSEVLAVGRMDRRALTPGLLETGLTVALDGVQDAGNVGTILRIADWFGFDRVLLSAECADVFSQKVINASMGSFARMPTFTAELPTVLATVKLPILGCDLTGDDVHEVGPLRDAVIVIGNEGHGLSPAVGACVTRKITIPRLGRAESLNAAVAAAIVCDNIRRG